VIKNSSAGTTTSGITVITPQITLPAGGGDDDEEDDD
jgi:hypothetical protein